MLVVRNFSRNPTAITTRTNYKQLLLFDKKMKSLLLLIPFIFFVQSLFLRVNADMADSKKFMSGKVLRIGVIHVSLYFLNPSHPLIIWKHKKTLINWQYPPVINITKLPDGTTKYSGTSFGFLDYIAEALNIT